MWAKAEVQGAGGGGEGVHTLGEGGEREDGRGRRGGARRRWRWARPAGARCECRDGGCACSGSGRRGGSVAPPILGVPALRPRARAVRGARLDCGVRRGRRTMARRAQVHGERVSPQV